MDAEETSVCRLDRTSRRRRQPSDWKSESENRASRRVGARADRIGWMGLAVLNSATQPAAGPCPGRNSSRVPAAAAIRSRDDLQKVPVGVLEVDTTSPVVAINFIGLGLSGISPVGELPVTDSTEDFIEL